MSSALRKICLFDLHANEKVSAELHADIGAQQLADWQNIWLPELKQGILDLYKAGARADQLPQSWHWDWNRKTHGLKQRFGHGSFSVVCEGITQGMILVDAGGALPCELHSPPHESLLYIDFLEVAPWNRPLLTKVPKYKLVGTALVAAAVELSFSEGFKGRVGLHSLPQAEGFYRDVCGMTDLGCRTDHYNLRYFEMTEAQAYAFLKKGEQS